MQGDGLSCRDGAWHAFYKPCLQRLERGRVASLLLQFIPAAEQNQSGEVRLQLPIKQADAAGLLAMSKEHYNRMLRELKGLGIIRRSRGWIYISN